MAVRITDEALLTLALELPEVVVREHHQWTTIAFGTKGFGWVNHDTNSVMLRSTRDECEALLATAPQTYAKTWASESSVWVEVRLEDADPSEVVELLAEAWRLTATKKAVAAYDAAG